MNTNKTYVSESNNSMIFEQAKTGIKERIALTHMVQFLSRLFRKENITILIWLLINMSAILVTCILLCGPVGIAVGLGLFIVSVAIALSPVGEWYLRFSSGCKSLSGRRLNRKRKEKQRLIAGRINPLFADVYRRAKENNPGISSKIRLFVNNEESPNAFATGRKTICITEGLLNMSDEEIKGVLAHEFGHISNKDTDLILVTLVSNMPINFLIVSAKVFVTVLLFPLAIFEDGWFYLAVDFICQLPFNAIRWIWNRMGAIFLRFSMRKHEFNADKFAADLGYRKELTDFLARCEDEDFESAKGLTAALMSTHPTTSDRLASLNNYEGHNNINVTNYNSGSQARTGIENCVPYSVTQENYYEEYHKLLDYIYLKHEEKPDIVSEFKINCLLESLRNGNEIEMSGHYILQSIKENLPYFCETEYEYDQLYGDREGSPLTGSEFCILNVMNFYKHSDTSKNNQKFLFWKNRIIEIAEKGFRTAQAALCWDHPLIADMFSNEERNSFRQLYLNNLFDEAEEGSPVAKYAIGEYIAKYMSEESTDFLMEAAHAGLSDAWYKLARRKQSSNYDSHGKMQSLEVETKVYRYYKNGADADCGQMAAYCQLIIGDCYFNGRNEIGFECDRSKAYHYLTMAKSNCNPLNKRLMYGIDRMLEEYSE